MNTPGLHLEPKGSRDGSGAPGAGGYREHCPRNERNEKEEEEEGKKKKTMMMMMMMMKMMMKRKKMLLILKIEEMRTKAMKTTGQEIHGKHSHVCYHPPRQIEFQNAAYPLVLPTKPGRRVCLVSQRLLFLASFPFSSPPMRKYELVREYY